MMIIVCRFWRVVKPHVMRLPIIPGTPRCLVTNQSYLVYISAFAHQARGLSPTAGPSAGGDARQPQLELLVLGVVLLRVVKGVKVRD